jgi:membrane protein DedA with SNARE-associated domain
VNRDAAAAFVAHWGYLGVFAALFVEEAGVPLPVPGDLFIAALGAAGRANASRFSVTALVVFTATMGGTAVLFEISRRFGEPMLNKIGKRFGFSEQRALKVERWLERRGPVAIIVGRLTPGLRVVLTVAAGALRMRRDRFMLGTAIASVIWVSIYYWLGYALAAGATAALGPHR